MTKQERILLLKKQYAHLVGRRYINKDIGEAFFVTGILNNVEYGICVTNGAWEITKNAFLSEWEES